MDAYSAGDYTLIASACSAVPGRGMDVCQVTDGTPIASAWKMIVPDGMAVQGGEVDVYYKDIHKSYPVIGNIIQISWSDFFGMKTWDSTLDGEVEALATVSWKDNTDIVKTTEFRGLAKIIVTKAGYNRMPIDSGFQAWSSACRVQYSTAGRSAIKCQ